MTRGVEKSIPVHMERFEVADQYPAGPIRFRRDFGRRRRDEPFKPRIFRDFNSQRLAGRTFERTARPKNYTARIRIT
jgi:hypothetical protein